jgi:hypothetical protein
VDSIKKLIDKGIFMLCRAILFILVIFLTIGCAEVLTEDDVLGEYSIINGLKGNSLVINSDGTYIHQHKLLGKREKIVFSGEWEIIKGKNGVLRITFNRFKFAPIKGRSKAIGLWNTMVKKSWGKIILCFDSDISESEGCFTKKT